MASNQSLTERPPSQLLGAEHDIDAGVPVTTNYLLCTTPRSGSNLLCDSLAATGLMGMPTEYLEFGIATPYLARRWGTSNLFEFLEALKQHRVGANGVFGMKIHWHQLKKVVEDLAFAGRPLQGLPVRQIAMVLDAVSPDAHLIRLTRSDMVSQAVSLFKATGTQQWSSFMAQRRALPEYDYDELLKAYLSIAWSEVIWDRLLKGLGRPVLSFEYTEVTECRQQTVERIVRFVGLEDPIPALPAPTLERQRDDWNHDVRARFLAELAARDVDLAMMVPAE